MSQFSGKMKRKKAAVTSCTDCDIDFESYSSSQRHFSSRNHLQQLLARRNLRSVNLEDDADNAMHRRLSDVVEEESRSYTENEEQEEHEEQEQEEQEQGGRRGGGEE